jgi:signal transduction histidine kinase
MNMGGTHNFFLILLDVTDVDIAKTGEKILRMFANQMEEKNLLVKSTFEVGARLTANATIIEILFNNLISNAVRHSTPGGTVSIAGSSKSLLIRNSGERLENPEKLFERFHRSNKTSPIGNGLGLSILKKICDTYGYEIRYSFEHGMHTFEVQFDGRVA